MVSLVFITLLSCLFQVAVAQEEPVSKSYFTDVAIGGLDTVAYHKQKAEQHQAIEGDSDYTVQWKGAKWRFVNAADKEAFAANPEKYMPAYNGFCANALSTGHGLVKTDGSQWQIFDDQLYLFYGKKGRKRWLKKDYKVYKAEADKAWKQILDEQD
ncbi:MAG TPA: hypothetical protein ENJ41_01050 [Oceanospirillales bacterium]|nr:hypothetical protein [Oceanospirillales bacterium]